MKGQVFIFKWLFLQTKQGQNVIDIFICVDLGTLFHKSREDFQVYDTTTQLQLILVSTGDIKLTCLKKEWKSIFILE